MKYFAETEEENILIDKVTERAISLYPEITKLSWNRVVSIAHCNGCRLKLRELLEAGDFDFKHDVIGIYNNLNRRTGKLGNCFIPRLAE